MIGQSVINFIKGFEKCRLTAYQIKGDRPTIGWGNTFYENGAPVKLGDQITMERANRLFENILAMTERDVIGLTAKSKRPLNANQIGALSSFAYNVGSDIDADKIPEGLGDSTLLKKVLADPDDLSIRNEFLKWVSPGTIFEDGLRKRRKAEADLYFSKVSKASVT